MINVAAHLGTLAAREPNRAAIHFPNAAGTDFRHITFAELDRDSGLLARGLQMIGIGRGMRTVLMVPPSLEFFSLTFALFKLGAVPVLIDPGMGIRNLGICLEEATPEAFIGIPKAHLARRILRWGKKSIRLTATTGARLLGGQHSLKQLRQLAHQEGPLTTANTAADKVAAILFTSGSTGVAKGVVYTHGIFAAQVEMLRSIYGIQPGEIDLSTFPLFALFGPALGMTAVVPPMDPTKPAEVDPQKIISTLERFQVTNLFGSPALINRVGRYGVDHGTTLPHLKRVISAGAPVPAAVIERFTKLLPSGVQLFTPYGATESLPVANVGSDTILNDTRYQTEQGKGVCIGKPVAGMTACIIPISDEPIPQLTESMKRPAGEIGEIVVSGPVVTAEYFGRDHATRMAKMRDEEGRLWHRMGDLGYVDESGRLWFCGRKSHRVVTEQATLFTIPCEGIFNTHPDVYRTALTYLARVGKTVPVLCVELEKTTTKPWNEIEKELREIGSRHEITRSIDLFLQHPSFPVDIRHNAKIFREKLAIWAAKQVKA
jgi:acyl-CoA synthetase (AMP-forming)/AMP-acid ligase II